MVHVCVALISNFPVVVIFQIKATATHLKTTPKTVCVVSRGDCLPARNRGYHLISSDCFLNHVRQLLSRSLRVFAYRRSQFGLCLIGEESMWCNNSVKIDNIERQRESTADCKADLQTKCNN